MAFVGPRMHGDAIGAGLMRDAGEFQQIGHTGCRELRNSAILLRLTLSRAMAGTLHDGLQSMEVRLEAQPILHRRAIIVGWAEHGEAHNGSTCHGGRVGHRTATATRSIDGWAKLPPGMEFNADVAAVGVDKHDNVYAFNRGKHPMCVFDRDGNLLRTWGEGVFSAPHGVFMAPDDTIWLTDDGDHRSGNARSTARCC